MAPFDADRAAPLERIHEAAQPPRAQWRAQQRQRAQHRREEEEQLQAPPQDAQRRADLAILRGDFVEAADELVRRRLWRRSGYG